MINKETADQLKKRIKDARKDGAYSRLPTGYRPSLIVTCLIILSFLSWASLSSVEEHVRGSGRVIPSGKARIIQHLEGGIINSIMIREGQSVEPGQTLFTISNQRAQSNLNEGQIELEALHIRKQRLEAERLDHDDIDFTAQQRENYPSIVKNETQLFESRRKEIIGRLSALKERLKQKELRLAELNAQISNLKQEVTLAQEQLTIKERLHKSGAVSRSQYLDARSAVANFNTRIEAVEKEIPIVIAERAEISKNMDEARENWTSDVIQELGDVKIQIEKLGQRMNAVSDEVSRTAVKSPVKGVVNKLYINTMGGVIQPGQQLAEIIPIEETLIIEGRISTDDRGKIWPGLPVTANITAYDYTIYGGLKGTLTYISADSLIDQRGAEFYRIRVELESHKLESDKPVFPGMTADLHIMSGETTILHAILKPFLQIQQNAFREL